jgi:hypothetical protein
VLGREVEEEPEPGNKSLPEPAVEIRRQKVAECQSSTKAPGTTAMPSTNPAESKPKRKFFTVEEANNTLPLVRAIVGDVVRQYQSVQSLRQRLSSLRHDIRKPATDVYSEEIAHSQAEHEAEEARLAGLIDELSNLGIELKGPDGLCDFPSLRDGRVIYLCWRLGEPQVSHWHEVDAGFAGRQPLNPSPTKASLPTF